MSFTPLLEPPEPNSLEHPWQASPDLEDDAFARCSAPFDQESSIKKTASLHDGTNASSDSDSNQEQRPEFRPKPNIPWDLERRGSVRSRTSEADGVAQFLFDVNRFGGAAWNKQLLQPQDDDRQEMRLDVSGVNVANTMDQLPKAQTNRVTSALSKTGAIYLTKISIASSISKIPRHAKERKAQQGTKNIYEPKYTMQDPTSLPDAPKDKAGNHIFSYKLFRGPRNRQVKLHYINTLEEAETMAKLFHRPLIGLDTEFKPGCATHFKDRVSLIQLATEKDIALFHVARFASDDPSRIIPPLLRKVLESPKIIKAGSAVQSDAKKIETYFNLKVNGVVDLKRLLQIVHPEEKGQSAKLSIMTKRYFNYGLDKDTSNRSQDWKNDLSSKQIEYAASDAYASLKIFQCIELDRQKRKIPSMLSLISSLSNETPWTLAARKRKLEPETLYEALHKLRNELAIIANAEGHRIMTNATMREMAKAMPTTAAEVLKMSATKFSNFSAYAGQIADVVASFAARGVGSVKRQRIEDLSPSSPSSSQNSISLS